MTKPLTIKFTSNPRLSFKTEDTNHKVNISKSHPDVIKTLFREVAQMLYHHYGVAEAEKFAEAVQAQHRKYYQPLKP